MSHKRYIVRCTITYERVVWDNYDVNAYSLERVQQSRPQFDQGEYGDQWVETGVSTDVFPVESVGNRLPTLKEAAAAEKAAAAALEAEMEGVNRG